MTEPAATKRGSVQWVAMRTSVLQADAEWASSAACYELLDWLYTVARRRAAALHLSTDERRDVVQDAMTPIVRAIDPAGGCLLSADNPAAVLERVAARAVAEARHRVRMAGLGGVPANGQNWRARYPRRVGGEVARRLFEQLPNPAFDNCGAVDAAAVQVRGWIAQHIGVTLTAEAFDALVYVLDRLVAGVSRSALVRGGNSSLRSDPAMWHLGFTQAGATSFGVWLLGRRDAQHNALSVLDAALGSDVDKASVVRWHRVATAVGFGLSGEVDGAANVVGGRCSA